MSKKTREERKSARGRRAPTAFDYRNRLGPITGWSDDDLRRLPIFEGDHFEAGETYFNLNLPEVGPFMAKFDEGIDPGYLFVAKGSVPDEVWLRLVDSWGTDLQMGNAAPQPGAFDGHSRRIKTGYGASGQEGAGEGSEKAA
jgi:hypothetical protein